MKKTLFILVFLIAVAAVAYFFMAGKGPSEIDTTATPSSPQLEQKEQFPLDTNDNLDEAFREIEYAESL